MARGTIVRYLCIPAIVALGAFAFALQKEPIEAEMLLSVVLGGFLYYAAPYLVWALVVSVADFSGPVSHAGFIAASIALVALTFVSFLPGDPSGLPI